MLCYFKSRKNNYNPPPPNFVTDLPLKTDFYVPEYGALGIHKNKMYCFFPSNECPIKLLGCNAKHTFLQESKGN